MRTETFTYVDGDGLRKFDPELWDNSIEEGDIIELKPDKYGKVTYMVATWLYLQLSNAATSDKKDPYGIPNVNFTLIEPSDQRWEKYKEQRLERGFDNSELWSLDSTIIRFCLPRMKAFREIISDGAGYPGSYEGKGGEKAWLEDIDKVILAMHCYLHEFDSGYEVKERLEKIDEGFKIWFDHFGAFWY